jgi:phosphinothricin acetyltransferase
MTTVRDARRADLPAVAAIYARAAEATPATFDLEGHCVAWWAAVLADAEYPFLVAGEGGAVLGYARASRHKDRPGYVTTVETSVYVAETARGRGVGRALYAALLARLEADDRRRLAVAGIALPNAASERLHAAHGFTPVGTFHAVGVKFGRAIDVRWYERRLSMEDPSRVSRSSLLRHST